LGTSTGGAMANVSSERRVFIITNVCFLVAGITQTLMNSQFDDMGFAKKSENFINAMGNPVGQFLFAAFDLRLWKNWHMQLVWYAVPIVVFELGCNLFSQISIARVGSGMFQVIYSFVVVLNGLLSHFCLGRTLGWGSWLAVFFICGAVALSAMAQLALPGSDPTTQAIGLGAGLISTGFVSAVYVMSNFLLATPWEKSAPKPMVLAQIVGVMETIVISIYMVSYVVPNWQRLVVDEITPGTTSLSIGLWYAAYLFVCGVHQYSFYFSCSLGPAGAVTAGVNKCVQTAILFFLSSAFFCDTNSSQCLSIAKIWGAIGVCVGVLLYGFFGALEGRGARVQSPRSRQSLLGTMDSAELDGPIEIREKPVEA